MQDNKPTRGNEEAAGSKEDVQNPSQAGKEAINAGKLNEKDKGALQRKEDEAKDAENWRNEG